MRQPWWPPHASDCVLRAVETTRIIRTEPAHRLHPPDGGYFPMIPLIRIACPSPDWHQDFLRMLPTIVQHEKFSFRRPQSEARSREGVQEVVANCC